MSYKDVAVFLDPGEACDARVEYVVAAALRWRASVIGLDITASEAFDDALDPPMVERAILVRERFEDALSRVRLDGEYRLADPAAERVVWQARCADLVVAGPPALEESVPIRSGMAETVLLSSGRPVLFVPPSAAWTGRKAVVAWNGSREATRALQDALPLLREVEETEILAIDMPQDRGVYAKPLLAHLRRHGVRAELQIFRSEGFDPSLLVQQRALEDEADLLVMGAYSHSRMRERILGGMTREILETMTQPVLMSH